MDPSLPLEARRKLVEFLCAMAWSDFKVRDAERAHIERLIQRLELPDDMVEEAKHWLSSPGNVRRIDPIEIPDDQKNLFFSEASQLMLVDGELHSEEAETLDLLRRLLFPSEEDEYGTSEA